MSSARCHSTPSSRLSLFQYYSIIAYRYFPLDCCILLAILPHPTRSYRAAETIGCRVHGITLSKEQKALAEEKVGLIVLLLPISFLTSQSPIVLGQNLCLDRPAVVGTFTSVPMYLYFAYVFTLVASVALVFLIPSALYEADGFYHE